MIDVLSETQSYMALRVGFTNSVHSVHSVVNPTSRKLKCVCVLLVRKTVQAESWHPKPKFNRCWT